MTEKHYGGAASFGAKNKPINSDKDNLNMTKTKKQSEIDKAVMDNDSANDEKEAIDKTLKAGRIASEARAYALSIAKKDMLLLELAEKIEAKILELGGKPAFPVNLSIGSVAAHDTPSHDDTRKAHGLLKIDLGVHLDGFVADTAIATDLEKSEINKSLIESAQRALDSALNTVSADTQLTQIGAAIEKEIKKHSFVPIHNLSGHSIDQYDLHAGLTIPNYNSGQTETLDDGLFAIEPFSTTGSGAVRDGKPSGIYQVRKAGAVRDTFARQVLSYIAEEYISLPFCSRWIVKKFGTRALLALRQMETAGIVYQYPQLIEQSNGIVAQAEHTVLIHKGKVTITTK